MVGIVAGGNDDQARSSRAYERDYDFLEEMRVAATLQALTGIDAQVAERPAAVPELPFAVASARARAVRRIVSESWDL